MFPAHSFLRIATQVTEQLPIHPAILGIIPTLAYAIMWLVRNTEAGRSLGLRNVSSIVVLILALGATLMGGIKLPEYTPPTDVAGWSLVAIVIVDFLYGIWLRLWKYQQILYDLLSGQLGTPDAKATEAVVTASTPTGTAGRR